MNMRKLYHQWCIARLNQSIHLLKAEKYQMEVDRSVQDIVYPLNIKRIRDKIDAHVKKMGEIL